MLKINLMGPKGDLHIRNILIYILHYIHMDIQKAFMIGQTLFLFGEVTIGEIG